MKHVTHNQRFSQPKSIRDNYLKQLFHQLDIQKYQAKTQVEKQALLEYEIAFKQSFAQMMTGTNAPRSKDGYVIIGEQAYGKNEAYQKALQDIDYFQKHGVHMPALPYPTTPYLAKHLYPDVTKRINEKLKQIVPQAKLASKQGFFGVKAFLEENFSNNAPWDLQVNHGLPGQVPIKDALGHIQLDQDEFVQTTDQYAIYRGNVVRAGYLSNYIYGYAIAATGYIKGLSDAGAHGVAILNKKDGDNPKDIEAMHEGYDAYWQNYPQEIRPWWGY